MFYLVLRELIIQSAVSSTLLLLIYFRVKGFLALPVRASPGLALPLPKRPS